MGVAEIQGVGVFNEPRKNSRTPRKALIEGGAIRCPKCRKKLGAAYLGAHADGIEVICPSKNCHFPVRIEI